MSKGKMIRLISGIVIFLLCAFLESEVIARGVQQIGATEANPVSLQAPAGSSKQFTVKTSARRSGVSLIQNFYHDYLNFKQGERRRTRRLPFSRRFNDLVAQNEALCRAKAGGDICGWGADGDVYLDSQDYDSSLTPHQAGLRVTRIKDDEIKVNFNVFPSLKERNPHFYQRELVFKLVLENDKWVVDDLISSGRSAQDEIRAQIKLLQSK